MGTTTRTAKVVSVTTKVVIIGHAKVVVVAYFQTVFLSASHGMGRVVIDDDADVRCSQELRVNLVQADP